MSIHYSREQIYSFLRKNPIMSAAITGEKFPIATVLLFAVDQDFTIYFTSHGDTHKAQALLKNPLMSISVWNHNEMLVQASGSTKLIEDEAQKNEVIDRLCSSSESLADFWPPILRIKNNSPLKVFEFKPTWLRALDLVSDTITSKEAPFTELIF